MSDDSEKKIETLRPADGVEDVYSAQTVMREASSDILALIRAAREAAGYPAAAANEVVVPPAPRVPTDGRDPLVARPISQTAVTPVPSPSPLLSHPSSSAMPVPLVTPLTPSPVAKPTPSPARPAPVPAPRVIPAHAPIPSDSIPVPPPKPIADALPSVQIAPSAFEPASSPVSASAASAASSGADVAPPASSTVPKLAPIAGPASSGDALTPAKGGSADASPPSAGSDIFQAAPVAATPPSKREGAAREEPSEVFFVSSSVTSAATADLLADDSSDDLPTGVASTKLPTFASPLAPVRTRGGARRTALGLAVIALFAIGLMLLLFAK